MKFNPLTKTIYTNNNEFVKTMYSPVKTHRNQVVATTTDMRVCTHCIHLIVDTKNVTVDVLLTIISQDRHVCLN